MEKSASTGYEGIKAWRVGNLISLVQKPMMRPEPIPLSANRLISACVKNKEVIHALSLPQKLTLGILLMLCYTTRRGSEFPDEELLTFLKVALTGRTCLRKGLLKEVDAFLAREEQGRLHGILHTLARELEVDEQIVPPWDLEL